MWCCSFRAILSTTDQYQAHYPISSSASETVHGPSWHRTILNALTSCHARRHGDGTSGCEQVAYPDSSVDNRLLWVYKTHSPPRSNSISLPQHFSPPTPLWCPAAFKLATSKMKLSLSKKRTHSTSSTNSLKWCKVESSAAVRLRKPPWNSCSHHWHPISVCYSPRLVPILCHR